MLSGFGAVAGAALGPLFVQLFSPDVPSTIDSYAVHHPAYYWNGAGIGLVIGLVLSLLTIALLKKHEEDEAASGADAHAH